MQLSRCQCLIASHPEARYPLWPGGDGWPANISIDEEHFIPCCQHLNQRAVQRWPSGSHLPSSLSADETFDVAVSFFAEADIVALSRRWPRLVLSTVPVRMSPTWPAVFSA